MTYRPIWYNYVKKDIIFHIYDDMKMHEDNTARVGL